ncbi:hypothetical protein WJX72_011983 [[Myrmecia] bisecta]|uniref:HIRAN domain-containing protein n=1 Tax=[Myrmecia] bisecta TaxID=41462 RepID=A0AAW1Q4N0_9CHLO
MPLISRCGRMAAQWLGNLRPSCYAGSARGQPVPMRGPGPAEFKKAPGVAEARRQMLESLPLESFKVVGVSFEGRQEVVSKLQTAQALMLVKEPHNEHDPNAVAVLTLAGAQLGYVPRELTQNFTQDVTFASVYSFGANELGLYGAQVAVRPTLPPLTLDALPASLAAAANLSQEVAKDEWDRLRRTTYRNANFRCEITGGAGPDHPVECHERWYLDDVTHTAKLMGLMALAPEVHLAKHADRQKDERRRQAAIWTLQEVNEWNVNEADTYLRYVAAKAAERSQHAWKFDLGWLEAQGCQIPARLQALCRASPAIATP